MCAFYVVSNDGMKLLVTVRCFLLTVTVLVLFSFCLNVIELMRDICLSTAPFMFAF